jgi:hypothetical protein
MIQIGNFVSKLYCLELLPLARFVCAVQEREGVDAFQPKTRADAENSTCLGGRRWDEYRQRNIRTYSSMSREVLSALRSFAHNRIDVHTHLIPPFYGEQLKSHGGDEVEKMATEQNQKRNTKATNKSPHGQSEKPSTQRMRRGEKEGVETQGPVSEQAANDKNKTSDFIAYPTNKVVGFIDDPGDAQAALGGSVRFDRNARQCAPQSVSDQAAPDKAMEKHYPPEAILTDANAPFVSVAAVSFLILTVPSRIALNSVSVAI